MLLLCDCNNFFVSCERLAHPELRGRPVVVLSMNDGCVISRSNEVKAMGVPMGEPYFRVERLLSAKGVAVRSGDMALYKKVSGDVMRLLARCTDAMEAYSIDEAFLNLPDSVRDPVGYAARIRDAALRRIGIPLSVGVSPTKTLSKLAADLAKKTDSGVMAFAGGAPDGLLEATPVEDVWGVGRRGADFLRRWGVRTAGDFVRKDALWIKKNMSIRGVVTQYELKGRPCIPIDTRDAPPKSVQVSRTWGSVLESLGDVEGAIADHALKAGESLRRAGLAACSASVFLRYGYRYGGSYGYFSGETRFPSPVSSDPEILGASRDLLRGIFQDGYRYTQGGVILNGLKDAGYRQLSLFGREEDENRARLERFSEAVDEINRRFGERALYPAILAGDKKWRSRRQDGGGKI